jgi:hypothetical protein
MDSKPKQDVEVLMECVGCKARKTIDPRGVTDQPMCDKCYMPMIVIRASVKHSVNRRPHGQ